MSEVIVSHWSCMFPQLKVEESSQRKCQNLTDTKKRNVKVKGRPSLQQRNPVCECRHACSFGAGGAAQQLNPGNEEVTQQH